MSLQNQHPGNRALGERLPGERYWWIDGRGRVLIAWCRPQVVGDAPAEGRVCEDSGFGVIERIRGREAVLGHLCSGTLELLCGRFGGVRWAIADSEAVSLAAGPVRRSA
ncbi:MAG: hypothetical protein AAGA55_08265 [Planctomycetota bacterium]